ncbi:smoothelin-like isoform X1 [Lingula anatina]|uniref:Smoothelin-like isoform X1 n=1 Tax=Lingula anatina TaxID=7574 RepID=A0A1S3JQ78_LINAN|nr:smoothelin-like isoform X1 [Lingula anatina]|eukprot:XP_013412517.1 smoothelin-like isoform X1 [Lingula anatina]
MECPCSNALSSLHIIDGASSKTTTTTTTKTSSGFTKKSAPPDAQSLAEQFSNCSSPGTSGSITVKYQAWNSRDGLIENTEQTKTWGGGTHNLSKSKYPSTLANLGKSRGAIAALAGAKSARAAFQGMDAKTGGAPAKPNFLQAGAGRGRGGGGVTRSPSAIKQMLLSWTQAMTKEYANYGVNITNFSSSWNDGMAFCALIHHFFPDAFDFTNLDSKNRRANFTLAFDTAEQKADIAPLLDVEDMVRMENPDWKCVFTYIQSVYKGLNELGLIKIKSKK